MSNINKRLHLKWFSQSWYPHVPTLISVGEYSNTSQSWYPHVPTLISVGEYSNTSQKQEIRDGVIWTKYASTTKVMSLAVRAYRSCWPFAESIIQRKVHRIKGSPVEYCVYCPFKNCLFPLFLCRKKNHAIIGIFIEVQSGKVSAYRSDCQLLM